jgi:hypothetical protein
MAYKSQPTITRPANTTAYTAGDVVGGAFQLTGLPFGEDILVSFADLAPALTAVPSGMTSFRLYLYNAPPPSALADNAPFTMSAADAAVRAGYIDLGSPALVAGSGVLLTQVAQVNQPIRTGATGVWAYLVTNGAYTPAANSETYTVTVQALNINLNN